MKMTIICEYNRYTSENIGKGDCENEPFAQIREKGFTGLKGFQPYVCYEHLQTLLSNINKKGFKQWEIKELVENVGDVK